MTHRLCAHTGKQRFGLRVRERRPLQLCTPASCGSSCNWLHCLLQASGPVGRVASGRKRATAQRPQSCDAARQPGPVSPRGFRRPQLPAHRGPAARAGASRRAAAAAGGGRPGRRGGLRLRRGQGRRLAPGGAAAEARIADQQTRRCCPVHARPQVSLHTARPHHCCLWHSLHARWAQRGCCVVGTLCRMQRR